MEKEKKKKKRLALEGKEEDGGGETRSQFKTREGKAGPGGGGGSCREQKPSRATLPLCSVPWGPGQSQYESGREAEQQGTEQRARRKLFIPADT